MNLQSEISCFDPQIEIEKAHMPPASWYTHQDFLNHEYKTIFSKTWQPVARVEELKEVNSYISGVTANIPWVITKDESNQLRAFYNVCSHKGREVVRGCGKAKDCELVCGYHAWKFKLNGELKLAPKMAGVLNFDRSEMGMLPMAVEVWGNWIFINGDLDAIPLAQQIGILTKSLEDRNWKDFKFHSSKEWTIKCNWKVYIDNYLDGGYHIPYMHPSLDAQLNMDSYSTKLYDTYNIQSSDATTDANNPNLDYNPAERIGDGSLYAWMFPNFMLNLYGDCLDTNYVLPVDKDTCKVKYEFYYLNIEGEKAEEFIQTSIKQSDVTQIEDIEICESVQLGLNSGVYRRGRYAPQLEIGEHQFHKLLHKSYLH